MNKHKRDLYQRHIDELYTQQVHRTTYTSAADFRVSLGLAIGYLKPETSCTCVQLIYVQLACIDSECRSYFIHIQVDN